jgi:hypothetical protein
MTTVKLDPTSLKSVSYKAISRPITNCHLQIARSPMFPLSPRLNGHSECPKRRNSYGTESIMGAQFFCGTGTLACAVPSRSETHVAQAPSAAKTMAHVAQPPPPVRSQLIVIKGWNPPSPYMWHRHSCLCRFRSRAKPRDHNRPRLRKPWLMWHSRPRLCA